MYKFLPKNLIQGLLRDFTEKCDKTFVFCMMGGFAALAFPPVNLFFCFLISFAWFFIQLCEYKSFRAIALRAFYFFLFFHVLGLYWLAAPLTINFAKHAVLIPFALTIVPAYFALQLTFALIPVFFKKSYRQRLVIFSLSLSFIIYFYSNYLPGFAWLIPGYIWSCSQYLIQPFSIFGIYGFNLITILLSSALGAALLYSQKKSTDAKFFGILSALIFAFIIIFSTLRVFNNASSSPLETTGVKARIVQCSLKQANKMNKNLAYQNFFQHAFFCKNSDVDFIIWPEVSFPHIYKVNTGTFRHFFDNLLKKGQVLFFGAVRENTKTNEFFNSVIAIDHNANDLGYYDKFKLVPFGEYIPLRKYIPFQSIANDMGDFNQGERGKILNINGVKFLPAICYEAVFPDSFFSYTSGADVILNITNDAWFANTSEPFQHLQIVKCRAVEFGIPVIRATNFGISAVFDPYGKMVAQVPIKKSACVDFYIPKKINPTIYARFGDSIFFGMLILLLFLI